MSCPVDNITWIWTSYYMALDILDEKNDLRYASVGFIWQWCNEYNDPSECED